MTGFHLKVKAADKTFDIRVGPAWLLQEKKFTFTAGDEIEVTGAMMPVKAGQVIIACEVKKGGSVLVLGDAKGFPRSQAPPNRLVEVLVQLADGNTGTGRSGDIDERHKAGYEIAQRSRYQLAQDHERTGITHKMRHIPQLSDYCPPSLVLSALDNALKRNGLVIASRSMDHSTRESCQSRDREIEPLLELGLTLSSNSKETSLRSRGFSREVAREKAHGAQPRQ